MAALESRGTDQIEGEGGSSHSFNRDVSHGLSTNSLYPYLPYRSPVNPEPIILETPRKFECWDHGCNGRQFSTFSNLLRHQREASGTASEIVCYRCGAEFTRKTTRDGHLEHDKCRPAESGTDLLRASRDVSFCQSCRNGKIRCDGNLSACTACGKVGESLECSSTAERITRNEVLDSMAMPEIRIQEVEKRASGSLAQEPTRSIGRTIATDFVDCSLIYAGFEPKPSTKSPEGAIVKDGYSYRKENDEATLGCNELDDDFTSGSNFWISLRQHLRSSEMATTGQIFNLKSKITCLRCGAEFITEAVRDEHVIQEMCDIEPSIKDAILSPTVPLTGYEPTRYGVLTDSNNGDLVLVVDESTPGPVFLDQAISPVSRSRGRLHDPQILHDHKTVRREIDISRSLAGAMADKSGSNTTLSTSLSDFERPELNSSVRNAVGAVLSAYEQATNVFRLIVVRQMKPRTPPFTKDLEYSLMYCRDKLRVAIESQANKLGHEVWISLEYGKSALNS